MFGNSTHSHKKKINIYDWLAFCSVADKVLILLHTLYKLWNILREVKKEAVDGITNTIPTMPVTWNVFL